MYGNKQIPEQNDFEDIFSIINLGKSRSSSRSNNKIQPKNEPGDYKKRLDQILNDTKQKKSNINIEDLKLKRYENEGRNSSKEKIINQKVPVKLAETRINKYALNSTASFANKFANRHLFDVDTEIEERKPQTTRSNSALIASRIQKMLDDNHKAIEKSRINKEQQELTLSSILKRKTITEPQIELKKDTDYREPPKYNIDNYENVTTANEIEDLSETELITSEINIEKKGCILSDLNSVIKAQNTDGFRNMLMGSSHIDTTETKIDKKSLKNILPSCCDENNNEEDELIKLRQKVAQLEAELNALKSNENNINKKENDIDQLWKKNEEKGEKLPSKNKESNISNENKLKKTSLFDEMEDFEKRWKEIEKQEKDDLKEISKVENALMNDIRTRSVNKRLKKSISSRENMLYSSSGSHNEPIQLQQIESKKQAQLAKSNIANKNTFTEAQLAQKSKIENVLKSVRKLRSDRSHNDENNNQRALSVLKTQRINLDSQKETLPKYETSKDLDSFNEIFTKSQLNIKRANSQGKRKQERVLQSSTKQDINLTKSTAAIDAFRLKILNQLDSNDFDENSNNQKEYYEEKNLEIKQNIYINTTKEISTKKQTFINFNPENPETKIINQYLKNNEYQSYNIPNEDKLISNRTGNYQTITNNSDSKKEYNNKINNKQKQDNSLLNPTVLCFSGLANSDGIKQQILMTPLPITNNEEKRDSDKNNDDYIQNQFITHTDHRPMSSGIMSPGMGEFPENDTEAIRICPENQIKNIPIQVDVNNNKNESIIFSYENIAQSPEKPQYKMITLPKNLFIPISVSKIMLPQVPTNQGNISTKEIASQRVLRISPHLLYQHQIEKAKIVETDTALIFPISCIIEENNAKVNKTVFELRMSWGNNPEEALIKPSGLVRMKSIEKCIVGPKVKIIRGYLNSYLKNYYNMPEGSRKNTVYDIIIEAAEKIKDNSIPSDIKTIGSPYSVLLITMKKILLFEFMAADEWEKWLNSLSTVIHISN